MRRRLTRRAAVGVTPPARRSAGWRRSASRFVSSRLCPVPYCGSSSRISSGTWSWRAASTTAAPNDPFPASMPYSSARWWTPVFASGSGVLNSDAIGRRSSSAIASTASTHASVSGLRSFGRASAREGDTSGTVFVRSDCNPDVTRTLPCSGYRSSGSGASGSSTVE